VTFCMIAALYV